jgi:hypothetical protein
MSRGFASAALAMQPLACVEPFHNVTLAIADAPWRKRNPIRAFAAHAPNFAPRHGHAEQCREFFGAEQRVVIFGDTFERRRYLFGSGVDMVPLYWSMQLALPICWRAAANKKGRTTRWLRIGDHRGSPGCPSDGSSPCYHLNVQRPQFGLRKL